MPENQIPSSIFNALPAESAYNLSDVVKTRPQFSAITPRWLTQMLEFKGLKAGVYRVNRVTDTAVPLDVLSLKNHEKIEIPKGYIGYETAPREYRLSALSTILNVDTRINDVYSSPYDQAEEQLSLAVEVLKERQEHLLLNGDDYGILKNAPPARRISPLADAPTPDDLDELLALVWKEPSFFLAHPRAIAAFLRECTLRGVPPQTTTIGGGVFVLWRGIPIVPSDKIAIRNATKSGSGKTDILLIRTGEEKRGVIGLYQTDLHAEAAPGLSVRFRGVDDDGIGSYLISLYCAAAVLSDDAVGVLQNVEIGLYRGKERK
ncbi:MAG: hypothetical protein LBT20_08345 [Clostridiales bacterium]|jgi:hypothetical protein|nr:hypothetical protein [Clostridiales bacterium]